MTQRKEAKEFWEFIDIIRELHGDKGRQSCRELIDATIALLDARVKRVASIVRGSGSSPDAGQERLKIAAANVIALVPEGITPPPWLRDAAEIGLDQNVLAKLVDVVCAA